MTIVLASRNIIFAFAILAYSTSLPVSAEGFLTPALSSLNNFAFSAIANWQLGVMSCFIIMCGCEWWEWINELQKSYVLWFALKSIETAQKNPIYFLFILTKLSKDFVLKCDYFRWSWSSLYEGGGLWRLSIAFRVCFLFTISCKKFTSLIGSWFQF